MTKIKGTTPQNNNNSVNTSPTSSPRSQNNGAAALNTGYLKEREKLLF